MPKTASDDVTNGVAHRHLYHLPKWYRLVSPSFPVGTLSRDRRERGVFACRLLLAIFLSLHYIPTPKEKITAGDDTVQDIADALKVLADPARLRILKELIGVKKEKHCCVRELADRLQISQPNVSHHLKVLKNAGFISCQKLQENDQRFAYYSVDKTKIDTLFHDVLNTIS